MIKVGVDISNSHVERVLGLGIGSISQSRGNCAEMDALLKIVEHFPWMLDVAANGFQVQPKSKDALTGDAGFIND